jgi:hypothetical protein
VTKRDPRNEFADALCLLCSSMPEGTIEFIEEKFRRTNATEEELKGMRRLLETFRYGGRMLLEWVEREKDHFK